MIRKYFIFLIPVLLGMLLFSHCRKQALISATPSIQYLGYSKISYQNFNADSLLYLQFSFEDGDGDIGLELSDTASPFRLGERYYYNVFAEYQAGKAGVYSYIINGADTVNYNDRISNIQPETRNKAINGVITLKIEPIVGLIVPDSIQLKIYLVDRALHQSNIISTGPIPVNY